MTFCMRFLFWGASRIAGVFASGFRQTVRRISTTNAIHGNSKRGAWKRRAIGSEPHTNEAVKSTAHLGRIREATNSQSVPARRHGTRLLQATVYPDGQAVLLRSAEAVYRGRTVQLPRLQHGRWKPGMIGRVGKVLGFKGKPAAKTIRLAAFADEVSLEEIA